MNAPHRTSWRMNAWPHDLLVLRGHDVLPDERERALGGHVAARQVEAWLREPAARARLMGICREATGASDAVRVGQRLREAFERGGLVALRMEREHAQVAPAEGAQGDATQYEDEVPPPDVYVIAPEISLLGEGVTPLIHHQVRVLDPDTGEVVVGWRTTDDRGVIRAEVPENKVYRIEIMDLELTITLPPMERDVPLAVLLCRFVDESGEALAGEDVVVQHPDGHEWRYQTDSEGRLEVPCRLGPYALKIRAQEFDAHAVLPRDIASGEATYHFVLRSAAEDVPAPSPQGRLERLWVDDGGEDLRA